jgi:dipeptidyl aminopeptidase/acylaminoacyl peptidase
MAESKKYFVDTFSRVDKVPVSVLRDNLGNVIMKLETMDTSRLLQAGWKPPETFIVKAADNVTDLYGVMWKPFDFDPQEKYPVIVYCYPGPQAEPVPKTFFLLRNERVHNVPLAQLGFIVISVGQRGGSPVRSKWYHVFGYGNARDYPLADNKYAVEQLATRYSFIDVSRVGIYGRSGGGFMSAAALLMYPDFYTAAFSSCGNHDNLIYNHSWGELHYGVKEVEKVLKTKEGEKKETVFEPNITTNPQVAKNLKGKLMLIHGEVDNNVHPANTLRLADALIKAGKRFDMMIFPGKRHTYGDYTSYIERMMWYFFAEHLKGDYRTNTDIFVPEK